MKKLIFLLTITLLALNSYSQTRTIDSLQQALKLEKDDTNKVNTLNTVSLKLVFRHKYDSSLVYANSALTLADKLKFEKGCADALIFIRYCHAFQGISISSIKKFIKALNVQEKTGNREGISAAYQDLGICYKGLDNYPEALSYFLLSLKTDIEVGNRGAMGADYRNIGDIYFRMREDSAGLKNEITSLKIYEEVGSKEGVADACQVLSGIYVQEKNYTEALKSCLRELKLGQEIKDNFKISSAYLGMGDVNYYQGNYADALKYYFNVLKISEEVGDMYSVADDYINIGAVYEEQGSLQIALKYYLKTISSSDSAKYYQNEILYEDYSALANVYVKLNNYKEAYDNEILFEQFNDSVYGGSGKSHDKLTSLQMQYDFNRQQDSIKAEQVKKDAITAIEIENQKRIRNYTLGGLGVVAFFLVLVFFQRNRIAKEKKRSDDLLLNILPSEVAEELKKKGSAEARDFDQVTVMFTDFKDFTKISEQLPPAKLVAEIDYCFRGFDKIIEKYDIEKIKTIGDSYMCAGGLPEKNVTNPEDVVKAALEIRDFMLTLKKEMEAKGEVPFEIRIGIHTGPVVAGIVGIKKFAYDIWGDTVNIASRMESSGEVGKVNISGTTFELVKNDFTCAYRGKILAKNKGEVGMYFVSGKINF